jgi:hypothetical protein
MPKKFIHAQHTGVVYHYILYAREIEERSKEKINFPYSEIHNSLNKINDFVNTTVDDFGFKLKKAKYPYLLKDPSKNSIVIFELLNILDDIVKGTPIPQDQKVKFNEIAEMSVFFESFSSNLKQSFLELLTDDIPESDIA